MKAVSTESDRVDRLVVETAKYIGVGVGDTVPVGEVREQAVANGYGNKPHADAIDGLLASAGLIGQTSVEVPPQSDLLGDMWSVGPDESLAGQSVDSTLARFRSWCRDRENNDDARHSYSALRADKRYARVSDVDRWFAETYDVHSTVFLTFTADRQESETVVDHAERFYPRSVTGKTRRVLDSLDVGDDYAGVRVLSPKPGGDRCPSPNSQNPEPLTHAHTFIWLAGEARRSDFAGVRDLHIKNVEGATEELHPVGEAVKARTHRRDGDTVGGDGDHPTALPVEVGRNLPCLDMRYDARGLPNYSERWCAHMRLGTDDSLNSQGVRRWRSFGRFHELADAQYESQRTGDD